MDRLHIVKLMAVGALAAGLGAATGCEREGDKKQARPSGERVDAVKGGAKKQNVTAAEFCDARAESAAASPQLGMPALAGGKPAPGKGSWRWINVWATWCKPCIEEMPDLARWHDDLAGQGVKFDLVFVSVDDSDDLVTKFRERHPGTPESLRFAQPDALPTWLEAIGLGGSAPIPVHVFVDPDDRVRCVRAGGVKEKDLPAVRSVLGAG
jgi:thiol-disulfide isomerase/thioredoxin